ncbi:helix-turn-helix domain-containing protein [Actinomadura sp. 9N407]|uniref:helix-turn-helix domain-containing protein n=1 Tax=Actinomadura sp. 9N407 TaxID=3375154 RepID=UPI0037BC480D
MAVRKPTPKTIAFGAELTRLRLQAGLSRLDLAKRANVSRSYIGQVETGATRCREDMAKHFDATLGTGTSLTDSWDDLLRTAAYPKWFADYPEAESTAALLRAYESTFVYGLLQTKDYASALSPSEAALEGRLKRQQVLSRKPPPKVVVVLEECVLMREVGSREVMRAQCEYLLEASTWEHVTLQIAPTAYYAGISGAFGLATQPNGEELLHLETSTGGVTSNDTGDILHCVGAFAGMQARCLSVNESRDFIRKAMTRWEL